MTTLYERLMNYRSGRAGTDYFAAVDEINALTNEDFLRELSEALEEMFKEAA